MFLLYFGVTAAPSHTSLLLALRVRSGKQILMTSYTLQNSKCLRIKKITGGVCAYLCVCMCTYMCLCTFVCMYMCASVCVHACAHLCVHVCACLCVHIGMPLCVCKDMLLCALCVPVCAHVCACICVSVCVCVCVCVCTCLNGQFPRKTGEADEGALFPHTGADISEISLKWRSPVRSVS